MILQNDADDFFRLSRHVTMPKITSHIFVYIY